MPFARDPLSVRYDGVTRQVMARAIRASRNGQGVRVSIASSRAEIRNPDAGGRTMHERAFTRSAYYLVFRTPLNYGHTPAWSLKISWATEVSPSSEGRVARVARLRIWPRSEARVRGPRWTDDPQLQSGGGGSPHQRF